MDHPTDDHLLTKRSRTLSVYTLDVLHPLVLARMTPSGRRTKRWGLRFSSILDPPSRSRMTSSSSSASSASPSKIILLRSSSSLYSPILRTYIHPLSITLFPSFSHPTRSDTDRSRLVLFLGLFQSPTIQGRPCAGQIMGVGGDVIWGGFRSRSLNSISSPLPTGLVSCHVISPIELLPSSLQGSNSLEVTVEC